MNNEAYTMGQQAYWRGAESPSDSPYAHAPKSEQHISWVAGWEDAHEGHLIELAAANC